LEDYFFLKDKKKEIFQQQSFSGAFIMLLYLNMQSLSVVGDNEINKKKGGALF